ncbi:nucleotidyltransferase family protein [Spirosoma flavum]|uniref:Nucleotidyltransferase family protein n=1 Tax=Spirosoma flavum TaxID=2048557 RepID=A0ABW6AUE4_9BACT
MKLIASELEVISHYLQDKPVVRAFIFGSYARGDADSRSDLDLLVELDYSRPIGLQFVGMKFDLEERLNKAVDLVSANGLSSRIRPFIDQHKQLIYERSVRR